MHAQVPGLAVVLVGSRKDSETYVRSKKKACAEVGIADLGVDLPEDATEQQVLEVRAWWARFRSRAVRHRAGVELHQFKQHTCRGAYS